MVKKKIQRNRERNILKLAKDNVDRKFMRRHVKEDLQLISYKLAEGRHLTDQTKASRLQKGRKMKSLCRSDVLNRIFFTDDKSFMVQPLRILLLLKGARAS